MFNPIKFKKLTATATLAFLMVGTLGVQLGFSGNGNGNGNSSVNNSSNNNGNSSCNSNNGHGNNAPVNITLSDGTRITGTYDPSNPGNSAGNRLTVYNSSGAEIDYSSLTSFQLAEFNSKVQDIELNGGGAGNSNCPGGGSSGSSGSTTNENTVSVELVLSVDVSTSVDKDEFELQRNGYIAAFQDSQVQQAIKDLPNGLAVTMQFWADQNVVDIGWFKLKADSSGGISNLNNFISKIEEVKRTGNYTISGLNNQKRIKIDGVTTYMGGGTDIELAIESAKDIILNNQYEGESLVIDVSGDGVSDDTPYTGAGNDGGECGHTHNCPPVAAARDAAIARGITINGLPINNTSSHNLGDEVDIHYEQLVYGGEGAFIEVADGFNNFVTAAKNKILREIVEAEDRTEDSDGDGISDAEEGKFDGRDTDGDGTADYLDTDSDNDSLNDDQDPNPYKPDYAD